MVNQVIKSLDTLAPKLINQISNEIDKNCKGSHKTGHKRRWATNSKNHMRSQNSIQASGKYQKTKIFLAQTKIIENNYKEMSFKGQIADKIYHGCTTRYANGKRKLIYFKKWKRCLLPTSKPFSRQSDTSGCCMQTRNSTKKRQLIVGSFKTTEKIIK